MHVPAQVRDDNVHGKSYSVRWDNNTVSDGHTDQEVERIVYSHEIRERATWSQRWCTLAQVVTENDC